MLRALVNYEMLQLMISGQLSVISAYVCGLPQHQCDHHTGHAVLDVMAEAYCWLASGGVKGKINQSMANGLPVVAYEVAMEGIDAEHGQDVMVAHDKEDFAAHIVELHANCNLWSRLSRGGLDVISRKYTERKARSGLRDTMQALGMPKPGPEQRHCRASSQVAGRLRT